MDQYYLNPPESFWAKRLTQQISYINTLPKNNARDEEVFASAVGVLKYILTKISSNIIPPYIHDLIKSI